jgi:hypothetical protein
MHGFWVMGFVSRTNDSLVYFDFGKNLVHYLALSRRFLDISVLVVLAVVGGNI